VKRDDWLTIYEIAEATKFDPATVRQWIEAGALEAFRLGHRSYRIPRAAW
jgi:excisionase family DNA binding protein